MSEPRPMMPGLRLTDLPYSIYERISFLIDQPSVLNNGFMNLGQHLGYDVPTCRIISARASSSPQYNYSPSLCLLEHYAYQGGLVSRLQRALETMNHQAAGVIPEYLSSWRRPMGAMPGSDGVQHSEPSSCMCLQCQSHAWSAPMYDSPIQAQRPAYLLVGQRGQSPPHTPRHPYPPDVQMGRSPPHTRPPAYLPGGQRGQSPPHTPRHPYPPDGQRGRSPPDTPPPPYLPGGQRGQTPPHTPDGPPQRFVQSPAMPNDCLLNFVPPQSLSTDPRSPVEDQFSPAGPQYQRYQNTCGQQPSTDTNRQQAREARRDPIGRSTHCLPNGDTNPQGLPRGQDNPNGSPSQVRRSRPCSCDKCRVSSDPDETLVWTTSTSAPRPECQLDSYLDNSVGRGDRFPINNRRYGNGARNINTAESADAHNSAAQNLGNQASEQPECCEDGPQTNRRKHISWPSGQCEEVTPPARNSLSSSEGSIADSRRNLQRQGPREIEQIYNRNSFNMDSHSRAVPTNERCETRGNGDLGTDDLMERLQNLNVRNESGWGASSTSNNESQPAGASGPRTRQLARNVTNREFVFVTFSWNPHTDDQAHLVEIINMCRMLRDNGIRVKIDMDPETFRALRLNKQDWLDKMAREAKYVIVCLSPAYYRDTLEHSDNMQPRPDMVQLNARYIFDILRAEYHGNGARNRRFIPVMFTNSGATYEHIPACMRSTLVYRYPDNVEDIIRVINGDEGDDFHLPYHQ